MKTDVFALRHIGPREEQRKQMLDAVGVNSIEELIDQTVPKNIRLQSPLKLEDPLSEQDYLEHLCFLLLVPPAHHPCLNLIHYLLFGFFGNLLNHLLFRFLNHLLFNILYNFF